MKKRFCLITLFFLCMVFITGCSSSKTETGTITDSAPTPTPFREGDIITVTSTSDSGPGTLRQALEDAQPYDTITFDPAVFLPNAPVTIYVSSELPHIRANYLIIDASNAGVILDGSQVAGEWVAGLQIVSSEANTIMGLQISHFPGPGIAISGDSTHNVIGGDRSLGVGPFGQGNLISNNVIGISLSTDGTIFNTITQNSIYNNRGKDIFQERGSNPRLVAAIIFDYDLSAGTATGATCSNCTVEIFSGNGYGGATYEGRTTADDLGVFTFDKSASFSGLYLTVTTTDLDGTTSEFSRPITGTDRILVLQLGNDLPRTQILTQWSGELADNRIATQFDSFGFPEEYDLGIYKYGVTRARVAIAGMEPELVDWDKPEFSIAPGHDDVFTRMADNGLTITYVLTFWDKETYPGGEGAPCARFKTEGEIERYLEFVRFTVDHFKDRVQYYEIWNEPDVREYCPKWIESADYINLVKRTVPVIREVYPEAKIVVGSVSKTYYSDAYNYLLDLLESDIMPLVDVIAWHPFYGESPEDEETVDYYYDYPAMVEEIKATAAANGFVGEYHADELSWTTSAGGGNTRGYSLVVANKYFSRSALMHLGMDIDVGIGTEYIQFPNLCTVMVGAVPADLEVEIESTAENIVSYTFSLDDGGYLVAFWTDGIAVDDDPGVETTLTIPGFSASEVIGIDILHGFEQELIFEMENGNLIIYNLIVKDYPIIFRITGTSSP